MNDKRVVIIGGVVVGILFVIGLFFVIKNKVIKPASATVDIKCETSNEVGELKVYQSFNCSVLGTNYTFTVQDIKDDKMILKVDKTGLTQVKPDGTINLLDKQDTFEIEKGDTLKLAPQVTDASSRLELTYKK